MGRNRFKMIPNLILLINPLKVNMAHTAKENDRIKSAYFTIIISDTPAKVANTVAANIKNPANPICDFALNSLPFKIV